MSITLYDLYHQSKHKYQLKLIAGEQGLKNVISWVQFTEDIKTIHFLKGSELILTTGLNSNGDKWICEFIQELIDQNSTGLIINTGNYIFETNINDEIKAMCDENHFPLFLMPWEIHLSDIMQDYCDQILSNYRYQDSVTTAFKDVILHPEKASTSFQELNDYGFYQNETYCILAIDFINIKEFENKIKPNYIGIANLLNHNQQHYHMYLDNQMLVIILHNVSREILETIVESLDRYKQVDRIGIGDICDNINNISLSHYQAISALSYSHHMKIRKCYFNSLGIYRILYFVTEVDQLEKMYKESLSVLEEYDRTRSSNLLKTLELYVLYDGSIQIVADQTFTHRNTVNYRVKKIKEILRDDIDTMESKFKLQMAFYIKNYLELKKGFEIKECT